MNGYIRLPDRPDRVAYQSRLVPILGAFLRVVNAVFAAIALVLLGYAFYLDWHFHHHGGDAPQPPPSSPDPYRALHGDLLNQGIPSPFVVDVTKRLYNGVGHVPWFIYAVGGTGAYILVTALTGVSGVRRSSRWRLAVYIALISTLILVQSAALLLVFTDNGWKKKIPDDPSGSWKEAQHFIEQNASLVKVLCLSVVASELAALAAASWLHSLQQTAYEAWLDDREEAEARAREALQQTVERQFAGGSSSLWSQRMRQKYGVDESQVECNAAAVRQVAALTGDVPA